MKTRRDEVEEKGPGGGGLKFDVGGQGAEFWSPGKILMLGIHTLALPRTGGILVCNGLDKKSSKLNFGSHFLPDRVEIRTNGLQI